MLAALTLGAGACAAAGAGTGAAPRKQRASGCGTATCTPYTAAGQWQELHTCRKDWRHKQPRGRQRNHARAVDVVRQGRRRGALHTPAHEE